MHKKMIAGLMIAAVAMLAAAGTADAAESKYATGTSSAALTFGPSPSGYAVQGLYAKSDKAASVVQFYARGGAGRVPVTAAATNGATVIEVDNSGSGLAQNDVVVYAHANGSIKQTTISAATTTNVTLAAAIASAGSTGDAIYELTQQFQMACGAATVSQFGEAVFYSPADSPVYIVLDGTSACTLGATAKDK